MDSKLREKEDIRRNRQATGGGVRSLLNGGAAATGAVAALLSALFVATACPSKQPAQPAVSNNADDGSRHSSVHPQPRESHLDQRSPRLANSDEARAAAPGASGEDVLIVYLSRTDNTKAVAEIIHDEVGGTPVELKLKTPYPEDYDAIVAQVDRENETGYLPPLATQIEDMPRYETVFLGFPTWDMQLPPPMKSFLNQYALGGKTLIPFNTNGGYGVGSSFQDVKERAPEATVLEGFTVEGGYEKKGIHLAIKGERKEEVRASVRKWLRSIDWLPARNSEEGR